MLSSNKKKFVFVCQIIFVCALFLTAQAVFAQQPFGNPASAHDGGPIKAGGTITTASSTEAGGSIPTATSTTSGGEVTSGGTTQSGGSVESGGATPSGGTVPSGGATPSGGSIGSGGSTRSGGSIQSGGNVSSGGSLTGTCAQYAIKTVWVPGPNQSVNNPDWRPATTTDYTKCLVWVGRPAVGGVEAGGNIPVVADGRDISISRSFTGGTPKDLKGFITLFIDLIKIIIPIIGALALWIFFWGLAKFIKNSGSEKAIEEGKDLMIWGIIALFVMVSVYGLVNLLYASLFGGGSISLPGLPT